MMRSSSAFQTLVVLGAGLGAATPALAQDTATSAPATAPQTAPLTPDNDGTPSDIIVTGSRIARPDLAASSPVATISAEAIKLNNSVTVEQILSANPQFGAGDNAADNNPGTGAASIDLRRLGTTAPWSCSMASGFPPMIRPARST